MTHTDSDFDHTYYLEHLIRRENFEKYLPLAIKQLEKLDFDAIAFRGMSGALTAPVVAHAMGKQLIMCRKREEVNHSGRAVEGFKASKRYVIVDDIISSGHTVSLIQRMISVFAPNAECIGILQWCQLRQVGCGITEPEGWVIDPDTRYDEWGKAVAEPYKPPFVSYVNPREPMSVYYTTQEELNNVKSNEQKATESSTQAFFEATARNASVHFSGLQRAAVPTPTDAKAERVKRETRRRQAAERFREFTSKLYATPRNYLVQGR